MDFPFRIYVRDIVYKGRPLDFSMVKYGSQLHESMTGAVDHWFIQYNARASYELLGAEQFDSELSVPVFARVKVFSYLTESGQWDEKLHRCTLLDTKQKAPDSVVKGLPVEVHNTKSFNAQVAWEATIALCASSAGALRR